MQTPQNHIQLLLNKFRFRPGYLTDNLPEEVRDLLHKNRTFKTYSPGRYLFHEGSVPRGIYYLEKGKVYIYKADDSGNEQIIYFYRDGDLIGYRPVLCNEKHPVSAVTLEESLVSFLPREFFLKALKQSGDLARKLLENLSYEFTVWTNKVYLFSRKPVKVRTALTLLLLSDLYRTSENSEEYPDVVLSREILAAYAGTVKETLVRNLTQLKQRNIIQTSGQRIRILKPQQLLKIVLSGS